MFVSVTIRMSQICTFPKGLDLHNFPPKNFLRSLDRGMPQCFVFNLIALTTFPGLALLSQRRWRHSLILGTNRHNTHGDGLPEVIFCYLHKAGLQIAILHLRKVKRPFDKPQFDQRQLQLKQFTMLKNATKTRAVFINTLNQRLPALRFAFSLSIRTFAGGRNSGRLSRLGNLSLNRSRRRAFGDDRLR